MEQPGILIVDDDPRNIFALRAVLKSRGYPVVCAASAQEGMNYLLKDKGIGIVLMDMMMPDMDGYEAIRAIRQEEHLKKISVIAVTAQAMVGDREKCLQAGADEYLSKPVDVDLLFEILEKEKKG